MNGNETQIVFLFFLTCIVQYGFSQITCVYGSYSGTGAAHDITGIGFTPVAVIIKGGSNGAYVKTTSMGSSNSRLWANNGALVSNAITGFVSDGFSVGSIAGVNASGTTYYFVAFSSSFPGLRTGSYTGNGGTSQNITYSGGASGLGIFNIVIPASAGGGAVVGVDGGAYNYGQNAATGSGTGNGSGGIPASGMQVYNAFNSSGATYHYMSFINSAGVSNRNSYSGNGSDNRNYTGLGFNPTAVFIYKAGDVDVQWKNSKITTDATMFFTANATGTNRIQSFITGGFQLGNDADVNASGSTYYYMGVGGSSVSPLPIELFHFDVQCASDKRSATIHWTTASETNNDFFTIEKSEDGVIFLPIGTVRGAGNSTQSIDYVFTDNDVKTGSVSYYRLKQTDFDGKNKTFNIVAKNCESDDALRLELNLQENPINESAYTYNLNYNHDGLVTMRLYNNLGIEVDQETFYHRSGFNTYYRNLPSIAPGVYMLSVSDGKNTQTIKLVKQ